MTRAHPITVLPNGLRVITTPMPEMESVTVGLWIGVGGRYEPARISGISHFIEHLLFKGTRHRSSRDVSQAVEGIGGYLNAFTGEENTCYYAKASHRHLDTLLDVLADMFRHPRFAGEDIAKERQVIKEELLMYHDQPDHYVHELLNQTLWPGHPLGRSLTGTPASLDRIQRPTLRDFKATHYVAGKTVLAVAGHCDHGDVLARARRLLPLPATRTPTRFAPARRRQHRPQLRFLRKPVEQTHLAIGIRGCSRHDPRRFTLKLLSVILGENMSSRLFQTIREQYGLAYSIQSATSYYADTGVFHVAAGLDTAHLTRALRLILRELGRLTRRAPSDEELQRAKDYAIGQMRLGLESTTNQMMWCGEHLLAYGRVLSADVIEQRLQAVTPAQIQCLARQLFRDRNLNVAIITASRDQDKIRRLLSFP